MRTPSEEFKDKFISSGNAQERSNLILQNKDLLKPEFSPITKKLSNGYQVTYYVGKKDISVGDFPIAMDPHTAEELAHEWGYWLPTNKVVDDIHREAFKGGGVTKPQLLSASGYFDKETGTRYSPEDVAKNVSRKSAIIEFAKRIEKELQSRHPNETDAVTVTNGKIIISPTDPIDPSKENLPVFFKGIPVKYKKDHKGDIEVKFLQAGRGASPHVTSKKNRYAEYCTFARMVGNQVDVKKPSGETYTTTYAQAIKDPNIAPAFTNTPGQLNTYIPRDTSGASATQSPLLASNVKPSASDIKPSTPQALPKDQADKGLLTAVKEKAQEFGHSAMQTAEDLAGTAKKKLQELFADAHNFELLAFSALNDIEIKKIAKYNAPRKGMKTRWSAKYKKKIDCNNPKGFSQKAYCARKRRGGKYKS
jgi:hypothetical protein